MVNLTINDIPVSVPEGTTIMKAAASVGVDIPHLCYLEGINEDRCLPCLLCTGQRRESYGSGL